MSNKSLPLAILATSLWCSSMLSAQSGGIETLTGEMLFTGGSRVSVSHLHREGGGLQAGSNSVVDPLNQSYSEDRTTFGFDYGITSRFGFTALLPMVQKSRDRGATTTESSGLGDLSILFKWLVAHDYWERSGWHVAAAIGTELPTGETGVRDAGVLVSPGMQPGSGSWDPFVSLSANLELDRWRFDAIALYKDNHSGTQQWENGDSLALDFVGAYRFLHKQYPGPSANVKLGLLYRDQAQATSMGVPVVSSGSELWLGKFGLAWHPQPQWDIGFSLDVPLSSTYGGLQVPFDYQVSLSVGLRF